MKVFDCDGGDIALGLTLQCIALKLGGNCLKRCSAASRVAVCLWIRASRPVMWGIIDFRVMSGRIDFGHFPNSPIPPLCHSSLGACTLSKFKVCIAVVMVLVLGIGIALCQSSKFVSVVMVLERAMIVRVSSSIGVMI